MKRILFFVLFFAAQFCATLPTHAKKLDATLSFIIYEPGSNDVKNIVKEFSKNFSNVQAFKLTDRTNFYLHYILTDDNFIQYEITKRDNEDITGEDTVNSLTLGHVGSARWEAYKKDMQFNLQYARGRNDIKATIIPKPFKGSMVLYNSYGTELIRVESRDHYKTESGALKNTISQMRRAIDRQDDKMAIRQKLRCLFCDYGSLKEQQKKKTTHIAFIAHRNLFSELYGEISEVELPSGLVPYANIYSSLKDYKSLEHIIDTDAISFDNQLGVRRLPGHFLSETIKADAPEKLIEKIALAYKKNNFEELDSNNLTPLWAAISQQDTSLVKRLISLGTNVNQVTNVNGSYLTPLILSAQFGNNETTKVLLQSGAKKELTTPSSITAWASAMWLGKYDHAELLWPSNLFDFNTFEAQNLLIQAAYYGRTDKVKELLANGVSIRSRGISGDNIVIAAIKGIKTFSVEPDFVQPGTTAHKEDENNYWDIIAEAEMAGLESPISSSADSLRQTVLFHAYPDGSDGVKAKHINLISQLISKGVDPEISNINGQKAEQVYMDARMAYLDSLYESQLKDINQQRRDAAKLAQAKQDTARETALAAIEDRGSFSSRSRASSRAKRLKALEEMDERARRNGLDSQTSNFEKDTSDVDQGADEVGDIQAVEKIIREAYTNDLLIASEEAKLRTRELVEQINLLKQEDREDAANRKEIIAKLSADLSS